MKSIPELRLVKIGPDWHIDCNQVHTQYELTVQCRNCRVIMCATCGITVDYSFEDEWIKLCCPICGSITTSRISNNT